MPSLAVAVAVAVAMSASRAVCAPCPLEHYPAKWNPVRRRDGDRWEDWYRAWSERAAAHEAVGREALSTGHRLSAGQHLLDASVCYHFAKFMFVQNIAEMKAAHMKAVACKTLALPFLQPAGERIEIPYQGKTLAGNLRQPAADARLPVVVIISGMDSSKEEQHFLEQSFLERGMATLAFDGPGQGEGEYDFPIRHDYEVPAGAVFDWIATRADLDAGRIGISGGSMGSYYVPRVMAFDKRVKAGIANGGAFSVIESFDQRPQSLKEVYRVRTHSGSVAEAREKTRPFSLEGIAPRITAPLMIIAAREDKITRWQDAERLSREVSGPVNFLLIEGANHVASNRTWCHRTQAADWMAAALGVAKR
ncbi:MAG: alpha/beta hydrolase [Alphaproteobacteria bacterium]|nr:alpha/beta hydrolase [Alphaproteobacteria bacterium]